MLGVEGWGLRADCRRLLGEAPGAMDCRRWLGVVGPSPRGPSSPADTNRPGESENSSLSHAQ